MNMIIDNDASVTHIVFSQKVRYTLGYSAVISRGTDHSIDSEFPSRDIVSS